MQDPSWELMVLIAARSFGWTPEQCEAMDAGRFQALIAMNGELERAHQEALRSRR